MLIKLSFDDIFVPGLGLRVMFQGSGLGKRVKVSVKKKKKKKKFRRIF